MTPRETTKCFLRRMSYFPRCPRCCMGVAPVVVFVFSDQNVWAVCALNVCLCAPPGLQMAVKVTKSFTNNTTVLRAPPPDPIASTTIPTRPKPWFPLPLVEVCWVCASLLLGLFRSHPWLSHGSTCGAVSFSFSFCEGSIKN